MCNLPDYSQDPYAYELEERSRPDEMLMIGGTVESTLSLLDSKVKALVLDLCCGTGLSLEGVVDHPSVGLIVGVDNCQAYIDFAIQRFSNARTPPVYVTGDAVDVNLPGGRWDIVILCSAYHHIDDKRKLRFLESVRRLIGTSGRAVLGENILPEYDLDDPDDYVRSVQFFYREVLKEARQRNPNLPQYVEGLIKRVAQYGYDGDYEYKTCYSVFNNYINEAGLEIESQRRVWPVDGPLAETTGGNYVVVLKARILQLATVVICSAKMGSRCISG